MYCGLAIPRYDRISEEARMTGEPTTVLNAPNDRDQRGDRVSEFDRQEARNALALQFRPYVYKIARELVKALRTNFEVDDLVGWGNLGLLEAAERFDPSRGIQFRSFAHARIRGAMVDAIRAYHGRHSREVEARGVNEMRRVRRSSVDAAYALFDGETTYDDLAATENEPEIPVSAHPDNALLADESRRLVERALGRLSPLEQAIIVQHYVHGDTVCVIARRYRLSKSWLSRVHTRAIRKLQRTVRKLERGDRFGN
jgi:RNA polymerase sigma factor FliA